MDSNIYCLVDAGGRVFVKDGARSHSEVAANFQLDLDLCDACRFDLNTRTVVVDRGGPASGVAARTFWELYVGSPEKLMAFAAEGRLTKQILAGLLESGDRPGYLDACAVVERKYTVDCAAKHDPCLEPGCALEDEVCLEPLMRAGSEYHQACGAAWNSVFEDPRHRVAAWRA